MASPQVPVTPASQILTVTASSTPGNWEHPRMREIALRRKAATFDDENFSSLIMSTVGIVLSFLFPHYIPTEFLLQAVFSASVAATISSICLYALWCIRAVLVLHGANALKPLVKNDDLSDIALTPSQRHLLGLQPTPTPPASGDFHTPPRYTRSTSGSSRVATAGSSPFARSISASGGPGAPGSAGSSIGSGASPLMRQAIKSGSGKRWSLGTPSGFDESIFGNGGTSIPTTPSPVGVSAAGGQRAVSVSLNSKWLYKRQHGGSPGSVMGKYI